MFLIWQVFYPRRRRHHRIRQNESNGDLFYETGSHDDINNLGVPPHNTDDGLQNQPATEMDDRVASSSSSDRNAELLSLNVKYRNASTTVKVFTDQSITDVKTTILQSLDLLPTEKEGEHGNYSGNYRLIYCGCPLSENLQLLDLNLENESYLHVVKVDSTERSRSNTNSFQGLAPSDYFIYCPVCRSIQASKLRTKCFGCLGLNTFLIEQSYEPTCRDDVLACPTVRGNCSSNGCQSTEAKFIFQCRQTHGLADSVPLKHIRNNARRILCITCEDVHTPVIVFPCENQHTMCLGCFKIYSEVCLNERRFEEVQNYGYTLPCPAHCRDSYIQESHHFHILESDEYERFKNFAAEECLIKEGGVICPNPKCGQGMIPGTNTNIINCMECNYEFCRHCSCDGHSGACGRRQPMESVDQSMLPSTEVLKRCQWENKSMALIDEISKSCPECNVKTEKNGGCNHMRCSRCRGEWCWICVKPWNRDCMDDHWLD